ncbi:MAG: DUF523 and DUF1722 domain-containing protein [bacterium]|nr:DUF523 and DUF1722 domain-containing protein [bacterium]
MKDRIKLGISSCLLGEKVRYDGGHQLDRFLTNTLGQYVEWVPVCPEVECGLPIPREAMRLVGSPDSYRLVTNKTGVDHTDRMLKWAAGKLKELEKEDLCGFVFKNRSPSSGMQGVKIYSASGIPASKGPGIFAGAFMKRLPLLPVEDDGRLNDARLRENFIERIFVMKRWQELRKERASVGRLVAFHTSLKLLVLSHSTKHYREMGRLVARGKEMPVDRLYNEYFQLLMEGLKLIATVKKNTNVLQHLMGHFKKELSADEKAELVALIGDYHGGLVPLIVPLTLLKHYVRKFKEPYLEKQFYLNPHPTELMLRNHV